MYSHLYLGNEYWAGMLSASGDPAAACCTQIPELQNPYINDKFMCASNLHIVSPKFGLIHLADYAKKMMDMTAEERQSIG